MIKKKKPVRKCVGCRQQSEKNEFIRLVKLKTGEVLVDFTGKQNGRGAYICKNVDCFNKARKENAFQRAFKCQIPDETFDGIETELERVTKD
ncbi:MAG: YlxR family protein [Bacillota bacterium]|nr:YlxR family protein [Bacillota bacterium]